jgi:hypothetical protein
VKSIFKFVLIRVDEELLWSRILERVTREPERVKYNEDSKNWMEVTNAWYQQRNWDYVIDNNSSTIPQLMELLVQQLSSVNGNILFPEIFPKCSVSLATSTESFRLSSFAKRFREYYSVCKVEAIISPTKRQRSALV